MWLITFIMIVFWSGLYLLPSIVAGAKKHRNSTAILAVNLLFGWTLLGWGIALAWALKKDSNNTPK